MLVEPSQQPAPPAFHQNTLALSLLPSRAGIRRTTGTEPRAAQTQPPTTRQAPTRAVNSEDWVVPHVYVAP